MHLNSVLFGALFIWSHLVPAQEKPTVKEDSTYLVPIENVHLHLNKTWYSQGENLWFTAYVQNQLTKRPSLQATSLAVGIYDLDGNEIKRKLLFIENGRAKGHFRIDSTFSNRSYRILAQTAAMGNVKQLVPFSQEINIIHENPTKPVIANNRVILKTHPEGGDLIAGVYNTIGIQSQYENEAGIALKNLELVNDLGKVIVRGVATNTDGFGKLGFVPEEQRSYILQGVGPNGRLVKAELATVAKETIGLGVDNGAKTEVFFKLLASKEMINKKKGSSFKLVVYQNNTTLVEEWKVDPKEMVLSINRNDIPYGVNTAVLMDADMQPISRRLFFNRTTNAERIMVIKSEQCRTGLRDSLQIDFSLPEHENSSVYLSVSVLPLGTKAYFPEQSLIASFTVQPYTQSTKVNFLDVDQNSKQGNYLLDTKLITEGWGRYHWNRRVPEMKTPVNKPGSGITVSGKISDADLVNEQGVCLLADGTNKMIVETLERDKSFSANMILYNGDSLGVSLIGKKGKLRLPKVSLEFGHDEIFQPLEDLRNFSSRFVSNSNTISFMLDEAIPMIQQKGTIALEEVVVSDRLGEKDNKVFVNSAAFDGREITDAVIRRYRTVRTYLIKLGFSVKVDQGHTWMKLTRPPYPIVPVFINGMYMETGELLQLPLSSVKYLFYDRDFSDGSLGIYIILRDGHYVNPKNRENFKRTLVTDSYERPSAYFSPPYDKSKRVYQHFGAVHWEGGLLVKEDAPASMVVPTEGLQGVVVYVEGMSENGQLVSQREEIYFNAID